jgi:hypothetical protein
MAGETRSRLANSCLSGKQKFIRREMDFGNQRFAASRASSIAGGLINGRHTVDGFYAPVKDEVDDEEPKNDEMKSVEDAEFEDSDRE